MPARACRRRKGRRRPARRPAHVQFACTHGSRNRPLEGDSSYAGQVPLLFLLVLVLLMPLLAVLLMPVTLVQRYRVGTARRRARQWVATLNTVLASVSAAFLIVVAAITSVWAEGALLAALAGLVGGALLGGLGLAVSRWEAGRHELHFTPNRWLVLALVLLVSARLVYGLWRGWHAWSTSAGDGSWLAAAGVPGSLAAGGVVLGYYAAYWQGVRRRIVRHARAGAIVTIDHDTGRISYDTPSSTRRRHHTR